MSERDEQPGEALPEPEGVGEGAEYEIAEGDEREGGADANDHPDRRAVRGNPEVEESQADKGIEKLGEISGN